MGTFRSLLRVLWQDGLSGLLAARHRRRLARGVRAHARREREQCHRAGVIEFASVAARTALYEGIARRLEEIASPVAPIGVARLERLLAERPPFRDYGPAAVARNARIATILAGLDPQSEESVASDPSFRRRGVNGSPRPAGQIGRKRSA